MNNIDRLFIIGNGFDLAHNLPTGYMNFKKWIISDYLLSQYSNNDYFVLPQPGFDYDGGEAISDDEKAKFILYCIENLSSGDWKNFENELGKIDWGPFLDEAEDVFDREGDLHYSYTRDNREAQAAALHLNAAAFSELFTLWIDSIEIADDIEQKSFLNNALKESSLFLTFNYTRTLEDIYKIKAENIFHIHGIQGGNMVIGHGIPKTDVCFEDEYDRFSNYQTIVSREIQNLLRKPTQDIIDNTCFFKNLCNTNIKDIYSWGFSFSDVDLCYIKEICKNLDTGNIVWYLYNFMDWEKNIPLLKECGFKGVVYSFGCN